MKTPRTHNNRSRGAGGVWKSRSGKRVKQTKTPLTFLILALVGAALPVFAEARPNVLFIAVDDLNDWVGHLGGHPQARTPNIDRLARMGVSFTKAYCSAPLCNPSRVSLLTGIEPSKSGVYGNGERFRQKLPKALTLMQYFRIHGYTAKGGGKIFHGANRPGDLPSWDFYFKASLIKSKYRQPANLPTSAWAPWGPLDNEDSDMLDAKVVNWAISELEKNPRQTLLPGMRVHQAAFTLARSPKILRPASSGKDPHSKDAGQRPRRLASVWKKAGAGSTRRVRAAKLCQARRRPQHGFEIQPVASSCARLSGDDQFRRCPCGSAFSGTRAQRIR